MSASASQANEATLNELLISAGLAPLMPEIAARFDVYLGLLMRWNVRINLTAVRDPQDILKRHFVESIACAQNLSLGIRSLLDFGSGAGFPGIPIAICRPDITVTLAESQNKKASFLREALRSLGLSSTVFAARGETLAEEFDCVALRAVDQMALAVASAAKLIRESGWLAVMTTKADLSSIRQSLGSEFNFEESIPLPWSDQRILVLATKSIRGR
jgi:16S rRNA (guanine527-N7)-methyltransferase